MCAAAPKTPPPENSEYAQARLDDILKYACSSGTEMCGSTTRPIVLPGGVRRGIPAESQQGLPTQCTAPPPHGTWLAGAAARPPLLKSP